MIGTCKTSPKKYSTTYNAHWNNKSAIDTSVASPRLRQFNIVATAHRGEAKHTGNTRTAQPYRRPPKREAAHSGDKDGPRGARRAAQPRRSACQNCHRYLPRLETGRIRESYGRHGRKKSDSREAASWSDRAGHGGSQKTAICKRSCHANSGAASWSDQGWARREPEDGEPLAKLQRSPSEAALYRLAAARRGTVTKACSRIHARESGKPLPR